MIKDLIEEFEAEGIEINTVLDPMEGSGTVGDVCKEMQKDYVGLDLKQGFDLTRDAIPGKDYDMIFVHPPYWSMITYSDNPKDLSTYKEYLQFLVDLAHGLKKCFTALRKGGVLVLQIGDLRKKGRYYFMASDIHSIMPEMHSNLRNIIIKQQHNVKSNSYQYGNKFIPIMHEYLVVWRRGK